MTGKQTILAILALSAFSPFLSGQCGELTGQKKETLVNYVRHKYNLSSDELLEIAEKNRDGNCYRVLRFFVLNKLSPREWQFTLTPDQRFLTSDLYDLSLDPREEEKRKAADFRRELTDGPYPSIGPKDASVTVTVFSDFQCPACRKAAGLLDETIREGKVRVVFRNMPLPFHPLAKPAALAAACVGMQDGGTFWELHRFLFSKQGELNPGNLSSEIEQFLSGRASIDVDHYRQCLSGPEAEKRVEEDLSMALRSNIHATPTLFINDLRVDGAPPPEQLRSLIRQKGAN